MGTPGNRAISVTFSKHEQKKWYSDMADRRGMSDSGICFAILQAFRRAVERYEDSEYGFNVALQELEFGERDEISTPILKLQNYEPSQLVELIHHALDLLLSKLSKEKEAESSQGKKEEISFLQSLSQGECPENGELVLLAHRLNISVEFLQELRNQYLEGRGAANIEQ